MSRAAQLFCERCDKFVDSSEWVAHLAEHRCGDTHGAEGINELQRLRAENLRLANRNRELERRIQQVREIFK